MLRFYYNPAYKYTNRTIIDVSNDNEYTDKDYENVDTLDEINAHIIYELAATEKLPTYIIDQTPDKNGINRRYFFSGITQLRTNKYQISLLRDVISESQEWKSEQAFIEAGTATDYCKYKRWGLPFTNTKIAQQRFNINGANDKSSFFVFYTNTRHENAGVLEDQDLVIKSVLPSTAGVSHIDYTVNNLNEIPNFNYVGNEIKTFYGYNISFNALQTGRYNMGNTYESINPKIYINYSYFSKRSGNSYIDTLTKTNKYSVYDISTLDNYIETNYEFNDNVSSHDYYLGRLGLALTPLMLYQNSLTVPSNEGSDILYDNCEELYNNYVNKTIYSTNNNKLYTIKCVKKSYIEEYIPIQNEQNELFIRMQNYLSSGWYPSYTGNWCKMELRHVDYLFELQELGEVASYEFTFTANARRLPKSNVKCVNIVSDSNATDTTIAQCLTSAMENLTNENDTGRIIDVQYLPFRLATSTSSNIVVNNHNLTAQFLDTDDYSFTTDMDDITNINKETDTIKLVSPSRASQFLFRPYDNDGNMLFETKVTLKPFASVIYIRPSTQGLLMYDYDDKDCLVINEDNSLTAVTSQWTEYVYSNKNYSNIFEREIQGRAFERDWERKVEQAQAKADDDTARNITAQKYTIRSGNIPIFSSLLGAGAAVGGGDKNYLAAAQIDREYNEALYQQGIDQSRDLFKYQLENIKSQPSIPSKITTIDCKLLDGVYLEYYSTNTTELSSINSYYAFNGNRIENYGTFSTYWGPFVRGRIIRSNYYTQPEINEINRRLEMGIFTGGGI